MRLAALALLASAVFLTGCNSNLPRVLNPGGTSGQSIDLSPSPVELSNDATASTFTVQNDVAGVAYTPTADPSCQSSSGGIFVAGDGQAQVDIAGTPLMFVVYAVGTPPASCPVTVRSSDGQSASTDVTYQVYVVQQSVNREQAISVAVSPGVTPSSSTITKMAQVVTLAASGFSGTMTAAVSGTGCTGASGLEINPKQIAGGSGTFTAVAYGQGAISASCSVKITDSANNSVTVPITLSIGALNKFTVTPNSKVQFGCAGTTAPKHCRTIQTLTLQEVGASSFAIADKPALIHTCANAFQGPLKFVVNGGSPVSSVSGPTASVAFDGLLPTATLACSRIVVTDGGSPAQTVNVPVETSLAVAPPPTISTAAAPPCKGNDPLVAVPGAPHGMYVWNPNAFPKYLTPLANDVIGKDPDLCGASLVIAWADVEPSNGTFHWQTVFDDAKPYTDKGLTVNLLFSDSTEGTTNNITPAWVLAPVSQGGAPSITCTGDPQMPVYFSQQFEAYWEAFITAAVKEFSFGNSQISANVGYMRFATAGGAEALMPPGYNDGGACQKQWTDAGLTYDVWKQHEINIVNALAAQSTDKQLIISLPDMAGGPTVYEMSNAVAAVAASKDIGFSFESLGIKPVSPPAPCNPSAKIIDLHWCQAYHTYAGVVPLNMQPITATSNGNWNIQDLLQYALDNNIQVFELYPDDWIQADSPEFSGFLNQAAQYRSALDAAALVLGVSH